MWRRIVSEPILLISALLPIVGVIGVEGRVDGATVRGTFLHSGVPPTWVVVVVDGSAVDSVEGGGLLALCWVDNEEDLVDFLCKRSLTL